MRRRLLGHRRGGGSAGFDLEAEAPPDVLFSLKKRINSYSGAAIRVRRDSDNTEADINFSGNELDTAALLSFVGSGNGFIRTVYGQINGVDATQTTTTLQPQIVSAGSLLTEAGNIVMDFGTITQGRFLQFTTNLNGFLDVYSVLTVRNYDQFGFMPLVTNSSGLFQWQLTPPGAAYIQGKGGNISFQAGIINDSIKRLVRMYVDSANRGHLTVNSQTSDISANDGVVSMSDISRVFRIGNYMGGASWDLDGTIHEFFAYSGRQENSDLIKENINSTYGIF